MSNVNHRHQVSAGQLNGIAFERRGTGEPLLLIHGTGGSRLAWQPVIELLSRTRTLVLIDLPGHGRSPSLPASAPHIPRHYAELLVGLLGELGIDRVDVCGHSSGGWTAPELAKLDRARSVVAIAPAGLWPKRERRIRVLQLSAQYAILRPLAPLIPKLMRHPRIRSRLMRQGMARPENLTAAEAIEITRTFAATADLITHVRHTRRERFTGGQDLEAPDNGRVVRAGPVQASQNEAARRATGGDPLPDAARLRPPCDVGRPRPDGRHDPRGDLERPKVGLPGLEPDRTVSTATQPRRDPRTTDV